MSFKTKSQLAHELDLTLKTFQRKLKAANLHVPRGLISPKMQLKIFEALDCNINDIPKTEVS
ncbi:MAG: hypothetical protein AB8G11_12580 [Saprospiraceae bacterium]